MTGEGELIYETRGACAWLTINRPDRRNAINDAVLAGIAAGLERATADDAVRAIVITGAGERAFCAGADLAPGSASFARDFSRPSTAFGLLLRQAARTVKPLVARVNGHCMAGGMGLLSMCDLAVAAEHAIFGLPEVRIGLFPMQVLAVLRRLVLPRHLDELCLTGEPIDALHARTIGLINHVVPGDGLDAKVDWLLGRLVDKSPTAHRRGKFAMQAIADMSFEQAIAYLEDQIGTLALTEDAREGQQAFAEKRAPRWTGR
ncbi:MAG: enoyl-CoA hydratase/isomerase family protein [Gammaproteobacteria bacterium]